MILINNKEILTVCDGMTWNGAKDVVARTLSFDILYAPEDNNYPIYRFQIGDKVEWRESNKTLFYGYIENINYSTNGKTINVSCIDLMVRLLKSKCIGRFKGTFNELANNICGLFGLTNDIKLKSTHVHNIVSDGDKTYYEILYIALSSMFSRFTLYLDGITLKLCDIDVVAVFETGNNIQESSFSQDLSEIVTKVLIIDNEGHLKGSVQDDNNLKQFGLFQEVYNYNKDSKNNIDEAKKLLKGVENEATIVVPNNISCISGKSIMIDEPFSNLNGVFEILQDSHTIGTEDTMTLNVKYLYGMKNNKGIEKPAEVEKPLDTPYQSELTFEQSVFISGVMDRAHKHAQESIQTNANLFSNKKEAQQAYWKEYDSYMNKVMTENGFKKEGYEWKYNG